MTDPDRSDDLDDLGHPDPCAPECRADTSDHLTSSPGRWEEPEEPDDPDDLDRPRYRVLARPFDVHDAAGTCLPIGCELEVYRVDAAWLELGGDRARAPLGVTQVLGARPTAARVRATVVDYLRTRSDPRPCGARPEHVEVYALVEDDEPPRPDRPGGLP